MLAGAPLLALPLVIPGSGIGVLGTTTVSDDDPNRYLTAQGEPLDTQGNPVNVNGSLPVGDSIGESLGGPDTRSGSAGLPSGPLGIPGAALQAYVKAAENLAASQPACQLHWSLLASIGRIESNHARGGNVDDNGHTRAPILGPVLNGFGPVAAISDTDGGAYDGDTVWDRAVGPMQFIPSTWRGYASDGNGDGESNPNNIYDATVGAGRYLCSGGLNTADPQQRATAVFRYNRSSSYVATVLTWADAYARGVHPTANSNNPSILAAPPAPSGGAAPAPVTPPPAPGPTTPPPGTTTPPPGTTSITQPPTTTTTTPTRTGPSTPPSPPTTTTTTTPPPTCQTPDPNQPPPTTPPPAGELPWCEPTTTPSSAESKTP
ncbi:lytic transglycosylase domain-containing protein [Amycolatopsis suaedae]|uniref:Transglycosylase SLT domain-containing protein n=1 Tax=Amycolatopsis suaedae TaxID=2510978 RepID=A0A4Q7J922_9PSEU|nr:lytic murein transglycosylase [Amycolatopsis suaedae]RZQ63498.1 hypothetical protein EWH70_13800 [Amycolatopsis suaedae]